MDINFNKKSQININIEYCKVCDYKNHCFNLAEKLDQISENVHTKCIIGRTGSFEISINDTLVYSKRQSLALPDFDEVIENVKSISEGGEILPIKKEQPITCALS